MSGITPRKPIDKQEIAAFNHLTTSVKKEDDLEKIFLLTKEGFTKSAIRRDQLASPS
ncbi:MAG: hypothetical protein J0L78_12490 [Planctomycetes bacterium]|nr:hypothetical protein [Planctomycetota bacterium]